MIKKKQGKIIVDICMSIILLFLMSYQVTGDMYHEWIGAGMLVLFLLHNGLNFGWYKALFKGKYSILRLFRTIINLAVLVAIVLAGYSGIVMSRHVFSFLPITGGMATARNIHMAATYWAFILMSIHLGMHWSMVTAKIVLNKTEKTSVLTWVLRIAAVGIAVCGAILFARADNYSYMFLQNEFVMLDYEKSPALVIMENAFMMGSWIFIGYYLIQGLTKLKDKTYAIVRILAAIAVLACSIVPTVMAEEETSSWETTVEDTAETEAAETQPETTEQATTSGEVPTVYMTTDISSDGLMAAYQALGVTIQGENTAVKLSTGETGSNYLDPALIQNLVEAVNGTIVECNTAYGGDRANTAMHKQLAEDHGYTAIAEVDIMDEEGSMSIPIEGGQQLSEDLVGSHFANYDYFVVLSHFKGHAMAGYGGALKNISIGIASSEGKSIIHTANQGGSMWSADQDSFLESMADAGKGVSDYLNGNILYINVMNRLSVDCDCDGNPAEPDMHDIGILASTDPVALDQACIDLVYAAEDGGSLIQRIESRNGIHTIEAAEAIGLGSRTYNLESIDD